MPVLGQVDHVTLEQLAEIPVPKATETWKPLGHARVMDQVLTTLDMMRFEVREMDLAVSREGQRFFGTLDLATDITDGVSLAVGVRNSTDRSFSLSFCAGERVMCCSNLDFGSDIVITRKHTQKAEDDFHAQVIKAAMQLRQYRNLSEERIGRLQILELSDDRANSLMLQAYEQGHVGSRLLPKWIAEYREPSYEEFQARTAWSLFNSLTHCMKDRFQNAPFQAASETMAVQQFLST